MTSMPKRKILKQVFFLNSIFVRHFVVTERQWKYFVATATLVTEVGYWINMRNILFVIWKHWLLSQSMTSMKIFCPSTSWVNSAHIKACNSRIFSALHSIAEKVTFFIISPCINNNIYYNLGSSLLLFLSLVDLLYYQ